MTEEKDFEMDEEIEDNLPDESKQESIESEDDFQIPEDAKEVAKLIKQDLREYFRILPKDIMEDMDKYSGIMINESPDFAKLYRELPGFFQRIKGYINFKKEKMNLIYSKSVKTLDDYETRVVKAEDQVRQKDNQIKDLICSVNDLNISIKELHEKNENLWEKRVEDFRAYQKEINNDKIKTAAINLLLNNVKKSLSNEEKDSSGLIEDAPVEQESENNATEEPEIVQEEEKKTNKEKVYEVILLANQENRPIKQKDLPELTGIDKSNISRILKSLIGEGRVKRTKKGYLIAIENNDKETSKIEAVD